MTMVGADATRLDAAAAQMRRAADDLDAHAGALGRLLDGLSWLGQVASAFLNMWNSNHRPQLNSTAGFIRDAAAKLEAQARQQREASEGSGGNVGLGFGDFGVDTQPGTIFGLDWLDQLAYVKDRYGNGATLVEILTRFDELQKVAKFKDLFQIATEVKVGSVIGAVSLGFDIVDWVDKWDEQSGLQTAWDGVGLAIDGVGLVIPEVGLAKGVWDLSWSASEAVYKWGDAKYDFSGPFVDSVIAREGSPPNYEGVSGFFNYVGDGFENVFSAKAWGFQ
jgi:hypothetical protein